MSIKDLRFLYTRGEFFGEFMLTGKEINYLNKKSEKSEKYMYVHSNRLEKDHPQEILLEKMIDYNIDVKDERSPF